MPAVGRSVVALALATCIGAPTVAAQVGAAPTARLLLRDAFDGRQSGALASSAWSLRSGAWHPSGSPPTDAIVLGDGAPGLELRRNVAVRLDASLRLRTDARYRVRARIDPVVGDIDSLGWVSISLATDPESSGWVTQAGLLGFLVRSRGAIQVFTGGVERSTPLREGAVSPRDEHEVELLLEPRADADPPGWHLRGSVDRLPFEADLVGGDPSQPVHLYLGAHFHEPDAVSRVSEIELVELR